MPSEDKNAVKKEEDQDNVAEDEKVEGCDDKKKDSKPVKKEEFEEDDKRSPKKKKKKDSKPVKKEDQDECIGSLLRNKKPSRSRLQEAKPKKEERAEDDHDLAKPLTENHTPKTEKLRRMKKIKKEEKKQVDTQPEQNGKKREKKVYGLPGQKRDPPEKRDPLRIFYETLHKQVPNSEMAEFWMMESGFLPVEVAKKVFEKKLKNKSMQKLGSPSKSVTAVTAVTASSNKKKMEDSKGASKQSKNRKELSNGSDDDFVLSSKINKKHRAV